MSGIRKQWPMTALAGTAVLLSLLACSNVTLRGPGPDTGLDGSGGSTPIVDPDWPRNVAPSPESREQCRSAPRPGGWVAVSYLRLGEECPGPEDEAYTGVLLQNVRGLPVGSVLDICADQAIPRGWARINAPAQHTCEGARVEADQPTAIRIRKMGGEGASFSE